METLNWITPSYVAWCCYYFNLIYVVFIYICKCIQNYELLSKHDLSIFRAVGVDSNLNLTWYTYDIKKFFASLRYVCTQTVIQIDRHTDVQTYQHTDILTYRHTDRQKYRHTDMQTYSHTDIRRCKHTDILKYYRRTIRQTYKHAYICTYRRANEHLSTWVVGPVVPRHLLSVRCLICPNILKPHWPLSKSIKIVLECQTYLHRYN